MNCLVDLVKVIKTVCKDFELAANTELWLKITCFSILEDIEYVIRTEIEVTYRIHMDYVENTYRLQIGVKYMPVDLPFHNCRFSVSIKNILK